RFRYRVAVFRLSERNCTATGGHHWCVIHGRDVHGQVTGSARRTVSIIQGNADGPQIHRRICDIAVAICQVPNQGLYSGRGCRGQEGHDEVRTAHTTIRGTDMDTTVIHVVVI